MIISYSSKNNGCFWYRDKVPADSLKRAGVDIQIADMGDVIDPSLKMVKFSRGYNLGFEEFFFSMKDAGIKIWYDVDDAMDLVKPWNPFSIPTRTYLGSYYFLLNECDFITTTNPYLKEHLSKRTSKPIYVFPNCLNPKEWKERPKKNTQMRIGFSGSVSHVKDINMVLPAIIELQKRHDFMFVIYGFDQSGDVDNFLARQKKHFGEAGKDHTFIKECEKFTELLKQTRHEWHDCVRWEMHSKKLASLDLDIGICPLMKDDFNKCKTPIKFYEYAITGTTSLCSDTPPFNEESLAVVGDDSWYDSLEALIVYRDLRESTLKAQQKYVLENRLIDNNINILKNIVLEHYE